MENERPLIGFAIAQTRLSRRIVRNSMLASFALLTSVSPADAASGRSPQEVVAAKFDAVNRHDIGGIVASYASQARLVASDFCSDRVGTAEVERTYRNIFALVPDIQANVLETIAEGDRVAVRVVLQSRAPGRSFDLKLMNFFTVKNGLIIRDEGVFDNGGRACRK